MLWDLSWQIHVFLDCKSCCNASCQLFLYLLSCWALSLNSNDFISPETAFRGKRFRLCMEKTAWGLKAVSIELSEASFTSDMHIAFWVLQTDGRTNTSPGIAKGYDYNLQGEELPRITGVFCRISVRVPQWCSSNSTNVFWVQNKLVEKPQLIIIEKRCKVQHARRQYIDGPLRTRFNHYVWYLFTLEDIKGFTERERMDCNLFCILGGLPPCLPCCQFTCPYMWCLSVSLSLSFSLLPSLPNLRGGLSM